MKGKRIREFLEDLNWNAETEFTWRGGNYLITGYINSDGTYTLVLYATDAEGKALFTHTSSSRGECVHAFEKAKVFDGRTIYDVESEITVEFG